MNYSLSNMLGRSSAGVAPVISGTAFPGETLTSTNARQWYADGNFISGETGSTYVVRLSDIGKVITQTGSNALTIWHPADIAGVASVRLANSYVFASITPNINATNGDPVRRWEDLIGSYPSDQSDNTRQPIYRSTGQSGNPSLEFDGANDILTLSNNTELSAFSNVASGYVIIGCRDINPTAGSTFHVPFSMNLPGTTGNTRFSFATKLNVSATFAIFATSTTTLINTTGVASDNAYHVHTAEMLFSAGVLNQRLDGTQVSTANFLAASNSSAVSSTASGIGDSTTFNVQEFPGHICCIILVNQSLSATNRSRLERYAGLFGNLNIPLV
jgi:hypothetical protein